MPNTALFKQLTEAAASLEKAASVIEAADSGFAAARDEVKQAKEAAAKARAEAAGATKQVKAAAAKEEAEIGTLAKAAAAALRQSGLLSSDEQADIFASSIRDPKVALAKMAALAKHANPALRTASVHVDKVTQTKTADAAWDDTARKVLASFPR